MTTNLYPAAVFDETPNDNFASEVDEACTKIHEACKGFGTDEDGLIEALASQSPEMRFLINLRYEQLFDKDLRKVMASETGRGDFGTALQFLALGPNECEALILKKAMQGLGTKERLIWPVLCGRSNSDMELLKKTYFDAHGEDLGVKLAGELGGDFERLIFHCLQANEEDFDEEFHTAEKAEEDADKFQAAGQGQWGTDEDSLFKIMVKAPPAHLEKVNSIYVEKNECTLISALDSELGGDVEKGAKHLVGMKLKPAETVAKLIKSTCAGIGTDEIALTCALIRYQPILKEVNDAHVELFEKSIQDRVESEVGGDFKKVLLAVVNAACN